MTQPTSRSLTQQDEALRALAREAFYGSISPALKDDAEFIEAWQDGDFRTFCALLVKLARDGAAVSETQPSRWIPIDERTPEKGVPVLVYEPFNSFLKVSIDEWQEYREDPTSMGGPTIPTGEGWADHDPSEVTHWMPVPEAPRG